MVIQDSEVSIDEILYGAIELITTFGWQREGWSNFGAAPRCIRKAVWDSAANMYPHVEVRRESPANRAMRRVSEAIYDRRGAIGGINDWEYRKRTNQEAVIAVLRKAIEIGPAPEKPVVVKGTAF